MNRIFSITFLAALAASGLAAAAPAYTTPVGYSTVTFKGGSDTSFAVPLVSDTKAATVVASVSGSTLQIGTTLNANELQYVAGTQPKKYFVLVTSGTALGKYYPVSSNTSSSITVNAIGEDLSAISGQTIKVKSFWTLGTLFPSGAGVHVSTSGGDIKTRVFFNNLNAAGQNIPRTENYVYLDVAGTANDGWYDANNFAAGIQNDVVIYPDEFVVVRHPIGSADTTLTNSGEVFGNSLAIPVVVTNSSLGQDITAALPYPVAISPSQLGLYESGAFTASTSGADIKDRLFVYDNNSSGVNKPLIANYIYFDVAGTANDGWYDANNLGGGKVDLQAVIPANAGLVIRKPINSAQIALNWVFTAPVP